MAVAMANGSKAFDGAQMDTSIVLGEAASVVLLGEKHRLQALRDLQKLEDLA